VDFIDDVVGSKQNKIDRGEKRKDTLKAMTLSVIRA
jgi:hypothetical protein